MWQTSFRLHVWFTAWSTSVHQTMEHVVAKEYSHWVLTSLNQAVIYKEWKRHAMTFGDENGGQEIKWNDSPMRAELSAEGQWHTSIWRHRDWARQNEWVTSVTLASIINHVITVAEADVIQTQVRHLPFGKCRICHCHCRYICHLYDSHECSCNLTATH